MILCLFSAPLLNEKGDPIDALDIEAERNAIVSELSALNRQIVLRIGFATVDELAKGIKDGFNVLHFSGHGSKEALVFEDGKGGCQLVRGDYLKRLIGTGGPFELGLISACHSEPTGKMIQEAGVRHVIAVRRDVPILDLAAIVFAGVLYRHLLDEDSVQLAFDMAKLLVEGNPDLTRVRPLLESEACKAGKPFVPEEEKFLLLPIDEPSFHQKPLFKDIQLGSLSIEEARRAKANLPVRPQSFTGRSKEIYEIINKLLANRFVTVTGAGGIGKTWVAVEAARWFHLRSHFPHGIFILNLREATSSSRIIDLIGSCVGRQFAEVKDLIGYLQGCDMLLILDNAEGILFHDERRTQDVINSILTFVPNVKLLVTSQRLVGGVLPEPERVCRLGIMNKYDSARLFLANSKRSISEKEWQSAELKDLLEQLGGHPLSIVLMAKQLTHGVTIEELIRRIKTQRAKAIVVKGITDRDPEHGESLVASLASSYNNLGENSREFFSTLSMLPAGAQEFAIRQIFGEKSWDSAQELNDASLAEITEYRRVVLLPPVRMFAESVLTDEIRERHGPKIVEAMASYAMQFYNGLGSEDSRQYGLLFTLEEPNFRMALGLPCAHAGNEAGVSDLGVLATYLFALYRIHNRCREAKELEDTVVQRLRKLQDQRGLASTLKALGDLARRMDDLTGAKTKLASALELFRKIDDKLGEANTLQALGSLNRSDGLTK
jgi:hypothetical protein